MKLLLFVAYLAVAVVLLYMQPALFGPGVLLAGPLGFLVGRSRAEYGRVHEDLRRDWGRRNEYRSN